MPSTRIKAVKKFTIVSFWISMIKILGPPLPTTGPPARLSSSLALEAPVPPYPRPDKRSTSWEVLLRATVPHPFRPSHSFPPPPLWVWCPRRRFQVLISPARSWVGIETCLLETTRLDWNFLWFSQRGRIDWRPHIVLVFSSSLFFLADCDTDIRGSAQFHFL